MSSLTNSQRRLRRLQTASSGSHRVHISSSKRVGGRLVTNSATLTPAQARLAKEVEEKAEAERIAQLMELQAQRDRQDDYDAGFDDYEDDFFKAERLQT
ncbi:hypothetical protein B0H13DRAFT_2331695 [Mycena leptocephala]|nr:hypothetical protein B0H13DRAFT_2331695 [Mycena leptocephala]